MPLQRMLDYERAKKAIAIAKEAQVEITIPADTTQSVEFMFQVKADTGQVMVIEYFQLETPPEVEGNVILETEQGYSLLIEPNQTPNTTEFYDPSDYGLEHFYVKSFTLYARTIVDTTDDRTITLKFRGIRGVL